VFRESELYRADRSPICPRDTGVNALKAKSEDTQKPDASHACAVGTELADEATRFLSLL
jgi:hypothetical protein